MLDIILKGTITVLTPINISRREQPNNERGINYTIVPGSSGKLRMPHIPGETLKGLLRNCSADVVVRAMDEEIGLDEFYLLYKGGIKQSGSESVADLIKAREFRRANPVLGLYGAAAPGWLPACIGVGPGIPETADDVEIYMSDGARRDEFRLNPELLNRFSDKDIEAYRTYAEGVKDRGNSGKRIKEINKEIKVLGKSGDENAKGKVADLKAERAQLDTQTKDSRSQDKGGVGNTVGRPLEFKRGIAPGSVLASRIDITQGTEDEVGLLFATLKELSNRCRIGGFRSIGYGRFAGDWAILSRSNPGDDYEQAGTVSIAPEHFDLKIESAALEGALAAWKTRAADSASLSVKRYV